MDGSLGQVLGRKMATIDSFQYLEDEIISHLNCINDMLAFYGGIHLVRNLIRGNRFFVSIYRALKGKLDLKSFGKYAGKF